MARPAKNALHLIPLSNGRWKLHGYFRGRQIRKQSRDFAILETEKLEMEQQLATLADHETKRASVRTTWLSEDQLRDAEAAVRRAGTRRLLDCVIAAERVMVAPEPKLCTDALAEWLAALRKRRRFEITIEKNERRVNAFLTATPDCKHLHEVSPLAIERWVLRKVADYTQLTDARVVHAWLRFCVGRRWLASSPFELDLKDLTATARTKQEPRILTPEQCHALLAAAAAKRGGVLVPYVILACWCFMRHAEVTRTTRANMRLDAKQPVIEVRPRKRGTVSYRTVNVPAFAISLLRALPEGQPVPYSRGLWDAVRADAGLLVRLPAKRGKRRKHTSSVWQENILRHTGISYHYQAGEDIRDTCRQAGNSDDTAFRHYLNLPAEGASEKFYATAVRQGAAA